MPALSDESMGPWMEYMQKSKSADAVGVPVTIDVIDSNGNYRNVRTAVSDSSGMFALSWKPDIEGDFTVIASFAGSESYWSSSAETYFVVDPVPLASPEVEIPPDNSGLYATYSTIAIIAAIAVVGAVMVLLLRCGKHRSAKILPPFLCHKNRPKKKRKFHVF